MSPFVAPCPSSPSLTKGPEFPSSKLARVSLLAFLVYTSTLPILGQVDLNGDKSSDQLVFITNLGRIVAVRFSDARIIWFADGFSPAGTMAFGDLNGDGSLDVVVPDSKKFAVGLSGNSGERIWEGPDAGLLSPKSQAPVKKLAAASLKD